MNYYIDVYHGTKLYDKIPASEVDKERFDLEMESRFMHVRYGDAYALRGVFAKENKIVFVGAGEPHHDRVYFNTENDMIKFQMRYM